MEKVQDLLDNLLRQERYLEEQLLMTRGGIQALQEVLKDDGGEIPPSEGGEHEES